MKERCPHSAFTSTSSSSKFLAISWPSAGASKTPPPPPPPRRKTPGGRGEPEGRAVPRTHTCSFSHQHTLISLSLFLSFTHTLLHTHFLRPLVVSHPISSSLLFYFHPHTHTHMPSFPTRGDPLVSPSPEAPTYPREPCCGTARVTASEAQSPILHFLLFQRGRAGNSLGKKGIKIKGN